MTEHLTSASFPEGVKFERSEADYRRSKDLISMIEVIARSAIPVKPQHRGCPFCGSDPLPAARFLNRWVVSCDADDCRASVQTSGDTAEEAWKLWDRRA